MNLWALPAIVVLIEVALILVVRVQRRAFPWLITEQDERPVLPPDLVSGFIERSHDPDLGWVRRPDSEGVERGQHGEVRYRIDAAGSRALPPGLEPRVAAFGDSYVFCRQVEDGETWEAQWSTMAEFGVLNFGVGNYGVDQALLRYEQTQLPETVRQVVLGFVPETICRIHSSWKHYLEFGNTLAFKPRFRLDRQGRLELVGNVMRAAEDFAALEDHLPHLQRNDGFYRGKFRSVQFRFPYILSFLRHPLRNLGLMSAVALRALCRALGIRSDAVESAPFSLLMRYNIRDAHRMYGERAATDLLSAIIGRFVDETRRRGHSPLVLVMPQLMDLKLGGARPAYRSYFETLADTVPVRDLTGALLATDYEACYVNDRFGGHFSVLGNRLVADLLFRDGELRLPETAKDFR